MKKGQTTKMVNVSALCLPLIDNPRAPSYKAKKKKKSKCKSFDDSCADRLTAKRNALETFVFLLWLTHIPLK